MNLARMVSRGSAGAGGGGAEPATVDEAAPIPQSPSQQNLIVGIAERAEDMRPGSDLPLSPVVAAEIAAAAAVASTTAAAGGVSPRAGGVHSTTREPPIKGEEGPRPGETSVAIPGLPALAEAGMTADADPLASVEAEVQLRVYEQRVSNLAQSLAVGLCMFLGPVLRRVRI